MRKLLLITEFEMYDEKKKVENGIPPAAWLREWFLRSPAQRLTQAHGNTPISCAMAIIHEHQLSSMNNMMPMNMRAEIENNRTGNNGER